MKFDKLGWIVAAAMGGGILGMGFQGATPKYANVDVAKVFDDSDLLKQSQNDFQIAGDNRRQIVKFIQDYPMMLTADAEKYAALQVKPTKTDADKAEISRIMNDALVASNKQREVATKNGPSAEDMKTLQDFSARSQQNSVFLRKLGTQYDAELNDLAKKLKDQSMVKATAAIKAVAEKQGYTVVFSYEAAPYAANDITTQALEQMNKK